MVSVADFGSQPCDAVVRHAFPKNMFSIRRLRGPNLHIIHKHLLISVEVLPSAVSQSAEEPRPVFQSPLRKYKLPAP